MTTAQIIAQLLNTTDWQSIDTMLRQGFTREQVIRSYTVPVFTNVVLS